MSFLLLAIEPMFIRRFETRNIEQVLNLKLPQNLKVRQNFSEKLGPN